MEEKSQRWNNSNFNAIPNNHDSEGLYKNVLGSVLYETETCMFIFIYLDLFIFMYTVPFKPMK